MNFIDEPEFTIKMIPQKPYEYKFTPIPEPKSLIASENPELRCYKNTFFHKSPPTPIWNIIIDSNSRKVLQNLGPRY